MGKWLRQKPLEIQNGNLQLLPWFDEAGVAVKTMRVDLQMIRSFLRCGMVHFRRPDLQAGADAPDSLWRSFAATVPPVGDVMFNV